MLGDKFEQELKELKDKGETIYYGDEVGFKNASNIYKMWAIKGKQPIIADNSLSYKLNICGFVNDSTGDFIANTIKKGDSDNFVESMRKLAMHTKGEKITLILDNAKWHKTDKVINFAKDNNISILFLPPYAPHLNPIERLWHSFRRYRLKNRIFNSVLDIKLEFVDYFFQTTNKDIIRKAKCAK